VPSKFIDRAQKEIIYKAKSQHSSMVMQQMLDEGRAEGRIMKDVDEGLEAVDERFDEWIELARDGRYAPHRREQDGGPRDDGG
jgi:hypothetical protein